MEVSGYQSTSSDYRASIDSTLQMYSNSSNNLPTSDIQANTNTLGIVNSAQNNVNVPSKSYE